MTPSPVAPCPCGSARPFEDCCGRTTGADPAAADPAQEPGLDGDLFGRFRPKAHVIEEARRQSGWQADIMPLPWVVEEEPQGRPTILLITVGPYPVEARFLPRPTGEPEALASLLEAALERAVARVGVHPGRLDVRHVAFYRALEPWAARHGASLFLDPYLEDVDRIATSLAPEPEDEGPLRLVTTVTQTWAGWDLPEPVVRELFDAGAAFWRADQDHPIPGGEELVAAFPDGTEWFPMVLTGDRRGPVLVMFADPDDRLMALGCETSMEAADELLERMYILTFSPRDDLSRAMQREIAREGWTVADPAAYPRLSAANSPGGGVSRADAEQMAGVLRGLAGWALSGTGGGLLPFRDPESGVTIDLWGGVGIFDLLGDEPDDVWDERPGENGVDPHEDTEGPAEPQVTDLQGILELAVAQLNRKPRGEFGGLSGVQVDALLTQDWEGDDGPLSIARGLPPEEAAAGVLVRDARRFLQALDQEGGTRATQAGNLNRAFVRRMMDELEMPGQWWVEHLRKHREVVNEQDLGRLHELKVILDVAGLIKRRKSRFSCTRLGEEFLDEDRTGALLAHLFVTLFKSFNLAYLDAIEAGDEVQYGAPYSLLRFGQVAHGWRFTEDLVDEILLPFVRWSIPQRRGWDTVADVVRCRILDPLKDLGLAESESLPGPQPYLKTYLFRKTPLFDRLLRFDLDGV